MAAAVERIYRWVLIDPKRAWTQRELATRAGCSTGYVSKVFRRLVDGGILSRPYRNRFVLVGPAKLLTSWAARRRLPEPQYVSTSLRPESVEALLRSQPGPALTLFRAAWHRTKFMETTSVEAYVPTPMMRDLTSRLGRRAREPASVILFPSDGSELEAMESVDGVPVVPLAQNYVDLMAIGGQGPRVAMHLAATYGLLGE